MCACSVWQHLLQGLEDITHTQIKRAVLNTTHDVKVQTVEEVLSRKFQERNLHVVTVTTLQFHAFVLVISNSTICLISVKPTVNWASFESMSIEDNSPWESTYILGTKSTTNDTSHLVCILYGGYYKACLLLFIDCLILLVFSTFCSQFVATVIHA